MLDAPKVPEVPETKEVEIHPVVELLVKRMKSNPEEFVAGRWTWIDFYKTKHFNAVEAEILNAALRKLNMDAFHAKVMEQILNPEETAEKVDAATLQKNQLNQQALIQQAYQQALGLSALQSPIQPPSPPTPYATAKKLLGW
jgi:hypothetical protein